MGNAKSRNYLYKENSRNISNSEPFLINCTNTAALVEKEEEEGLKVVHKEEQAKDNCAVGGLLVELKNKNKRNNNKQQQQQQQRQQQQEEETDKGCSSNKVEQSNHIKEKDRQYQKQQKAADISAANAVINFTEERQLQQQRLKQASFWSLGSLNWNYSFSGRRNSFKQNRSKSVRKSCNSLQYQKRSKTQWHKPLTNTIFSSHFKESSRNTEFHIEQLVAKGAFGVVFKVKVISDKQKNYSIGKEQQVVHDNDRDNNHQSAAGDIYALKVLKKSKIISENSIQQIKDEVEIQKVCGHNLFIVQQFDLWQNRHNLHILSEYVPNGELFSKLASFSLDLVRVYLAEIALALDFLHNAGIIYRDAKPENILLTQNYHIKLIDFGLSKWLKFGQTTKTMCGTFQYMAPEILSGQSYTHSVDWWSLGIIVCQMFIKKSPDIRQFIKIELPQHLQQSEDMTDKVERNMAEIHTSEPNEFLDKNDFLPIEVNALPHEAQDVLRRLLEFNPHQRIRSVRALQRVAMYKDFKIDAKEIQKIRPMDIILKDNITIYDNLHLEQDRIKAEKAFKDF